MRNVCAESVTKFTWLIRFIVNQGKVYLTLQFGQNGWSPHIGVNERDENPNLGKSEIIRLPERNF